MPNPKLLIIVVAVFILLMQGLTGGLFLEMIFPDWDSTLGYTFCVAGGFIVQPVWDVGWAKIPIPVTDDVAAGLLIASVISWLFIRRTSWSWKRKVIALVIAMIAGMAIYKGIGLLLLYWAETSFDMQGCIGEFTVGPLTVQWEWFNLMFWVMIIFAIAAFGAAIYKLKGKAGGS